LSPDALGRAKTSGQVSVFRLDSLADCAWSREHQILNSLFPQNCKRVVDATVKCGSDAACTLSVLPLRFYEVCAFGVYLCLVPCFSVHGKPALTFRCGANRTHTSAGRFEEPPALLRCVPRFPSCREQSHSCSPRSLLSTQPICFVESFAAIHHVRLN